MNWQRAKDRIVGAVVFVLFDVRVQIPDVEEEGTFAQIDFVIHKAKLLERLKGRINGRQEKVLLRMLREGPEGFEGGMSARKYSTIAETAPATTTRDLAGLVEVGALIR